jgi:arabinose-5-phosphate isomerase
MASLGISSIFMHPTEAVHGDMGTLTADDLILALSHSGNSEELLALLEPVTTWLKPKVIALVGRRGGALDRFSTLILETGVTTEACVLGLAPTTSSTAALALGDALAVCVSKIKGIQPQTFAKYHPSGSLGRRLYVRVKEIMHRDYVSVDAESLLDSVVYRITQGGLGVVLVEHGKGVITDGDIRRAVQNHADWATRRAQAIMSSPPCCIHEEALAFDALALMESKKITALVVVDAEAYVVGIVHLHDILASASLRLQSGEAKV